MNPHTFTASPPRPVRRRNLARLLTLGAFGAVLAALCPIHAESRLQIEIPERDWVFTMSPQGVDFGPTESAPDGTIWVDGDGIEEARFSITVLIRNSDEASAATDCRSAALASRLHRDHLARLSDFGGMAVADYLVEDYRGEPVAQRRMHGYLFRDGICIDVGLSMLHYEPQHQPMLEAALRSVRIGPPERDAR